METTNLFKCVECEKIFIKNWSDAEAIKEAVENFGGTFKIEESVTICNGCFEKLNDSFPEKNLKNNYNKKAK